ncbi:MAG: DUF885 domain-containing protein [Theionarchaea archaeon]|nr:DUF885 domain-containing protein [Theionarchaea archaeon]MBU6999769.1 DUF885 domain-containing protein [Theionarchaea archaeon]MBU7020190.1 DUF885 domain-containing protein [Theionarchaea archaeon]MBU7033693.1 DUF885 domain-containing protein [Theionarchaea archaeon]MBU7039996.1 DUF885 domain-containing protein [Theionarchaea archaeon]
MKQAFDRLQKEFMEVCFSRRPQEASYLGFTEYDARMPSGNLDDRVREIKQDREFLDRFCDINKENLDFDQRISLKLAIHKLKIWLFVDETLQHYLMDPNASNEISSALNSLFIREEPERFYPILRRLEQTPQYIEDFKSRIVHPTKLWTEMAIEAAEGLLEFLPLIVAAAREEAPHIAESIEDAGKTVEKSLLSYISFLRKVLPQATTPWVMGKENFEVLLKLRKIPYTSTEILEMGKKWLKEEKETMKELARTIDSKKSIGDITKMVKSQHPPTFDRVLELYRTYIEKSRDFVIANDIVTMPENEVLVVQETPSYIRYQLPFAAYMAAPAVGNRIGHYWVTPPEDTKSLDEHSEPAIANTSVHEAYPGHHIQIFCSNSHPHLLRWAFTPSDVYAKYVSEGPELIEGWAHYCEEYMLQKGFSATPEHRFIKALWGRFRAIRIVADVQLSTGNMTFDEAVTFLQTEGGLPLYAARAEVKRYTLGPSYPLSYLLGKHMVTDLKGRVQQMMGSQFTDKFFHDTLIYEGTMPLALLEEIFTYRSKNLL